MNDEGKGLFPYLTFEPSARPVILVRIADDGIGVCDGVVVLHRVVAFRISAFGRFAVWTGSEAFVSATPEAVVSVSDPFHPDEIETAEKERRFSFLMRDSVRHHNSEQGHSSLLWVFY